jgi:hypothetical protein
MLVSVAVCWFARSFVLWLQSCFCMLMLPWGLLLMRSCVGAGICVSVYGFVNCVFHWILCVVDRETKGRWAMSRSVLTSGNCRWAVAISFLRSVLMMLCWRCRHLQTPSEPQTHQPLQRCPLRPLRRLQRLLPRHQYLHPTRARARSHLLL